MLWINVVLLFLAANQVAGGGGLQARIIEWTTGLPVADATVTLYRERAVAVVRRSGNDGLVTFENLPPGSYSLRVVAKGYGLKDAKQAVDGSDYQLVDVGPGTSLELRIDVVPAGTIAGTVRDVNDNPLFNIGVVALRKQYNLFGELVLARANAAVKTNDRGDYLMSGLPPGEYYIKVESQPPVYYPGSSDPRNVAPIIVGPTLPSVNGIHIQVRGDRPYRISGKVANFDRSLPEVAVDTLYLVPIGFDETAADIRTFNHAVARDGRFSIADVPPGPYDVIATLSSNGRRYFGKAHVDVSSGDAEDVELMLAPAADLAGSISVRAAADLPDVSRIIIGFTRTGARIPGWSSGPGRADRDGRISVNSVLPDKYRINVMNIPNGYYVDSILLDNLEVLEKSAVIYPSSSALQVTLNRPALTLTGKVVSERGDAPVEPLLVLLAPIDSSGDPVQNIQQTVSVRKTGDFVFPNVRPGRYRLFAFQNVPRGFPFYDPKFLDAYMPQGTVVTVEGPNVVANIVAIAVRP